MDTDAPTRPDRGGDPEKRRQILEGAREIFFSRGYEGASMDAIARAASVSKGTLYVYFENKDALFEALVSDLRGEFPEELFDTDFLVGELVKKIKGGFPFHIYDGVEGEDLQSALLRIATVTLHWIIRPDHIALTRTVIGAAGKFPHLGQLFFRAGQQKGTERLAAFFEEQMREGHLRKDDPKRAARHFVDLTVSWAMRKTLVCDASNLTTEDTVEHIQSGIEVFLRAYKPDRGV